MRAALDGVAPALGADVWIARSAQVIGRVDLGARASVWFGAVIRGDNEPITIGPETNIQDNAVLHSDAGSPLCIGAGCTIGHSAIVHGCRLGDNVLIGMGATVLNGAVIGEGSIVGAGALVTGGKEFAPGSMILGSPAKCVRALTDEEITANRHSAASYVANAARFAAGLVPIAEA